MIIVAYCFNNGPLHILHKQHLHSYGHSVDEHVPFGGISIIRYGNNRSSKFIHGSPDIDD